jgi:hypothetical protein
MCFCIPIAIGTGRWLKIWFQDNVSKSPAKTMTARALAGRPGDVARGQELSRQINLPNESNAAGEMFVVITNLSRPDDFVSRSRLCPDIAN